MARASKSRSPVSTNSHPVKTPEEKERDKRERKKLWARNYRAMKKLEKQHLEKSIPNASKSSQDDVNNRSSSYESGVRKGEESGSSKSDNHVDVQIPACTATNNPPNVKQTIQKSTRSIKVSTLPFMQLPTTTRPTSKPKRDNQHAASNRSFIFRTLVTLLPYDITSFLPKIYANDGNCNLDFLWDHSIVLDDVRSVLGEEFEAYYMEGLRRLYPKVQFSNKAPLYDLSGMLHIAY